MNLLPHATFQIKSILSPDNSLVKAQSAKITVSGRKYHTSGSITQDNVLYFNPEKKTSFFRNSFLPGIKMIFDQNDKGTVINIYAELDPAVKVFLTVFVIAGLIVGALYFIPCIKYHKFTGFYILIPEIISIGAYLISFVGLYVSTKSFQLQFEEFMDRKSEGLTENNK